MPEEELGDEDRGEKRSLNELKEEAFAGKAAAANEPCPVSAIQAATPSAMATAPRPSAIASDRLKRPRVNSASTLAAWEAMKSRNPRSQPLGPLPPGRIRPTFAK